MFVSRPSAVVVLLLLLLGDGHFLDRSPSTDAAETPAPASDTGPEPQPGESRPFSDEDYAFFEQKVRPILFARCYECHSGQAKNLKGGLRLDTRAGLLAGGDTGAAIFPDRPEESPLLAAVRYEEELQMPPAGKLPAAELDVLTRWVLRGSPFPEEAAPAPQQAAERLEPQAARSFWSFLPAHRSSQPRVSRPDWIREPLDGFILAGLDARQMGPSPSADARTVGRRIYVDLIGLPPQPGELHELLADDAPDRYERLVDQLLASPHYGERWGRFWLDLARYADQAEPWHNPIEHAYLYRDWVISALNQDVPYDDFVRRQLATDLMPEFGPEDHAALGFLGLSPTYWKELRLDPNVIKTVVAEEWEERISAVSHTFLGLTVECARCHDHKFDPITTADYYALAGVFASAQPANRPLIPEPQAQLVAEARKRIVPLAAELAKWKQPGVGGAEKPDPSRDQRIAELEKRIRDIQSATPYFDVPWVHGLEEASIHVRPDGPDMTKIDVEPGVAQDVAIQLRGSPANLGPVVPRRFLTVLTPEGDPRLFRQGSGRLELANAILSEAAPLASRVIVNRIWRQHFGRGIVDTPSNFGVQGAVPTHPELLNHLAASFSEDGWSLKQLHRRIVLSATYRQASSQNPAHETVDPENRWLWRMNRQRLEIEAWRDAMLVATGHLDRRIGGPSAEISAPDNRRRTVYATVVRPDLPEMLRLHDFPVPTAHSPGREPTTTPLQQLFVLNSPFLREQAAALWQRLRGEACDSPAEQVQLAYRLLYGRDPSEQQRQWAHSFLETSVARPGLRSGVSEPSASDTSASAQRQEPGPQQVPAGPSEAHDPASTEIAWQLYLQALLGSNEFLFVD